MWFLDEPFTNLDNHAIDVISQTFLDHSNNGGCIIFSSHQFFGFNMSYEYIDHPNTTSAVTYTPIWYNGHATSSISIGAVYYQGSLNDEYPQVSIRTTALEIGV